MKHSRTLVPVAAIAAVFALGGCSSPAATAGGSPGSQASYGDCSVTGKAGGFPLTTIKKGTLLAKAELPAPGWYNGDTATNIRDGFEFCLLANIAHRAGITDVELENSSFEGLVAGKAGDMDLSLNTITITPDRRRVVDFSEPYFQSSAGVLVRAGSHVTAANLDHLKIGVRQGTVGESFVRDTVKPRTSPAVFPGDAEMWAAVTAGTVDAGIQDLSILLPVAAKSHGKLKVIAQIDTGEAYGVLLPKGSPNTATVSKIIDQLREDGTLKNLSSRYLTPAYGVDPASIPVWKLP